MLMRELAIGSRTFWKIENKHMDKIDQIFTQILPFRFDLDMRTKPSEESLLDHPLRPIEVSSSAFSAEIGQRLEQDVLEPLIFAKSRPDNLKRPLLIFVIACDLESANSPTWASLANTIKSCGDRLVMRGHARESMLLFHIIHLTCCFPLVSDTYLLI
jgi:hypothetical protein